MVLVKNWQLFILGEIGQENVFYDTLERKSAFVDDNKNLKKSQNWDVFKGVIPKLAIFPSFHFRQNRPGNCVSRYSKKKKTPLSTM